MPDPAPVDPDEPPLQQVELTLGAGDDRTVVHLAGAWLEDDGSGHGTATTAEVAGSPPLVVKGDRSRWRLADKVMVFEGHVEATRADVVLHCERLEVRYEGERIREATATGKVRVTRGERRASSAEAWLEAATGRLVMTGEPRLAEGVNTMTGRTITLFLDDEAVECEACRLQVEGEAIAPERPR